MPFVGGHDELGRIHLAPSKMAEVEPTASASATIDRRLRIACQHFGARVFFHQRHGIDS
jgi:hypothetical protein